MDKINEVKNKLDERAGNPHLGMERQVALDALNVITEQESEITRLRADLAVEKNTAGMLRIDLSAANIAAEKLRKDLLAAKNAIESAEMSAKCSRALKEKAESENLELLEKCRRLEMANEQLRHKLNNHRDGIVKLSAECDEKTKEIHELQERLHEAITKASSFVVDPDEVDKIQFICCPVCNNTFRFFLKMPTPTEVVPPIVRFGEKKFGACPKCGSAVDSEDNKTACGRCGKLLDWGEDNAD